MASAMFSSLFVQVDNATKDYISDTVSNVATAFTPIANQMFTLYVILWGLAMYRGVINQPFLDAAFRLMKIALVMHFALNVTAYSGTISNNIVALPDYLMSLVSDGGSAASAKAALDGIFDKAFAAGDTIWQKAGVLNGNFGYYFLALFVYIVSLMALVYAAFLIILSKIALSIVLGLGGVFILGLMFESTKRYFESWVGQLINYSLVSTLTVAVLKLIFGIFSAMADSTAAAAAADPNAGVYTVSGLIIISIVGILVLGQVQNIAASLGGGISLATMGVASFMGRKLSNAIPSANSLRPGQIRKNLAQARANVRKDVEAIKAPVAWMKRKVGGGNSVKKAA